MHTGFWWGNLRERDNLEETGVEGRIMDLQEVGWGDMDWIDQAHDRHSMHFSAHTNVWQLIYEDGTYSLQYRCILVQWPGNFLHYLK